MAGGRYNIERGGGGSCPGRGGGGARGGRPCADDQPNRGRGRYRDAAERGSPGRQPSRMNQPPARNPPPHARGSTRPQLGGRSGGAWSASAAAAPPIQPPPPHGNEGLIQVRGGCCRGLGEFCLSISLQWWARLLISFSFSLGDG